jgi:hypothetical protein
MRSFPCPIKLRCLAQVCCWCKTRLCRQLSGSRPGSPDRGQYTLCSGCVLKDRRIIVYSQRRKKTVPGTVSYAARSVSNPHRTPPSTSSTARETRENTPPSAIVKKVSAPCPSTSSEPSIFSPSTPSICGVLDGPRFGVLIWCNLKNAWTTSGKTMGNFSIAVRTTQGAALPSPPDPTLTAVSLAAEGFEGKSLILWVK